MGSPDESLRLAAEIVDKFSGPLREMTKSIHSFQDRLKGAHTDGSKAARESEKAHHELEEQMEKLHRRVEGGVGPAMEALGLQMFGVGGAIGAMVEKLKSAGESFYKLQGLTRRTGLDVNQFTALQTALEEVGVSSEAAAQGLGAAGDVLAKLRRHDPEEALRWGKAFSNAYTELGRYLEWLKNPAEQFNAIFDFFKQHPNIPVDQKIRFYEELLHLPPEAATAFAGQMDEAIQKGLNFAKLHPQNMAVLKELNDAFSDLDLQIKGIGVDFTNAFGGEGATLVKGLAEVLHGEVRDVEGMLRALKSINDYLKSLTGGGDLLGRLSTGILHPPTGQWLDMLKKPSAPPEMPFKGQKFQTFPNGLYHPSSFDSGGGSNDATQVIKVGTLQALREWYAEAKAEARSGVMNAAYTPEGSGPGGGSHWGGGGYQDLSGGGAGKGGGRRGLARALGMDKGGDGVSAGSGPAPGGASGSARDTAKIVADEWKRAGMSDEGIAGLMANIQDESRFNSASRHPDQPNFGGEAHFAHGLYQEGGSEWNHYDSWLKKNYPGADWKDARLQSRFAAENLKARYPHAWQKMLSGNRFEAAAAYVNEYLKPAPGFRQGRMNKYLHGGVAPLESYTGPRDLISSARGAGVAGGAPQKVEGSASLDVNFSNMPVGVSTYMKHGGMFKDVTQNWDKGSSMPIAGAGQMGAW
jgi:hypothetical protein